MSNRAHPRWHLLGLPKIGGQSGTLTFVEGTRHVPFEIRRIFYVYDLSHEMRRGGHAHRTLHQVIVRLAGGLDIHLDDGDATGRVRLEVPWLGLHIPPLVWASEDNFAPGTVYLVLASEHYDASEYLRDYQEFLDAVRHRDR